MDDPRQLVMVFTTVETASDADSLAKSLVEHSLAACVQIDGPIVSHYRWAGKVQTNQEYRLMIKSSLAAWPMLKSRIVKLHPYDEPEIVMTRIDDATDGYRDWVLDQTT